MVEFEAQVEIALVAGQALVADRDRQLERLGVVGQPEADPDAVADEQNVIKLWVHHAAGQAGGADAQYRAGLGDVDGAAGQVDLGPAARGSPLEAAAIGHLERLRDGQQEALRDAGVADVHNTGREQVQLARKLRADVAERAH